MGLLDFQHLHQQVKNRLFEISYIVSCFNKTGDTDISRYAETYFKNLFNIIYQREGWNFEKAIKINQDTYDLIDKESKVYIQITSNKRQQKKNTTIKLFEDNYCNNEFEVLIILFIANSKPKKTELKKEFTYVDFNIIEFATFIEGRCNQNELLKIRDILFADIELQKSISATKTINREKEIKISEKEFLRCKKLEKDLTNELIYKEYWKSVDKEELAKYPDRKFKDSRFILRSIEDESYPNADGNSNWCRTFMYDFYEKGILIWLDALFGTTAIINEKEEWYIEEFQERNSKIQKDSVRINIRILGKLPYKHIVYWQDGDEYYNDYHLFCKYIGVENSPYEEIIYKYENKLGYFWDELDITKKLR